MRTTNGIDISDYTNLIFWYSVWYQIEDNYDRLAIYFSSDGQNWDMWDFHSGFYDWYDYSFSIPDGDYFYVSFVFNSWDASTFEEGAYVDNIRLEGDLIPRPNFTFGTPTGWFGPIVPSSIQNTHTVNTLYTGQPTFIDFAFRNIGVSTTEGFWTDLYLNGAIIDGMYTNFLDNNAWDSLIDGAHTIYTAGSHLLEFVIDGLGQVDEADEDDNSYFSYFTWVTPTIANLTTTIPPGWNGPIVPTDTQGHHYFGNLYSNQPTYIAWAIKNTGNTSSGAFSTRLKIDNVVVQTINNPSLAAGASYTSPDNFSQTLTAGNHVLRLEIDYTDVVVESNPNDNVYAPTFTWYPAEIMASGEVSFFELSGGLIHKIWKEARDFRVELWNEDGSGAGQVLDTDYTDNLGIFELGPVSNIEEGGGRQDIYIKAYAENYAAIVGDSFVANPPYNVIPFYISSYPIQDALSGEYSYELGSANPPLEADTIESGFFYIADVIKESYNNWNNLVFDTSPGITKVLLHADSGTFYRPSRDIIYINPSTIGRFPDTFDKDVILHELGHRLAYKFDFFDTSEGGSHTLTSIKSLEFAASEGFGYLWSTISRGESYQRSSYNNFQDTFWLNVENGKYGFPRMNTAVGTANTLGKRNGTAVGCILWDIFDSNVDDFSDSTTWYYDTGQVHPAPIVGTDTLVSSHHSDNIGDTLSLGIDEILDALFRNTSAGHKPDNINEFWETWFQAPSYGHQRGMMDIWYEHGACCVGKRGDMNWDGTEANISDLTFIIDRIFRGGQPFPCPLEADLNDDGVFGNVIDLNLMVDWIFKGIPLPTCP